MWFKRTSTFVLAVFFSCISNAQKITMACGDTLAPWVMAETNNGILIDIVTQALEPLGYQVEILNYPYARRMQTFKLKQVDVVCDINPTNMRLARLNGHFSGIIYQYENYFYALSKRNFQFKNILDLDTYSVLSWQGAISSLGYEYESMALNNHYYIETHDQKSQVKLLFNERVDIIQLDKQIFEYYRQQVAQEGELDTSLPVDRFAFLKANESGFLFQDEALRDKFVKQIALMKKEGRFQKIFEHYGGSAQ